MMREPAEISEALWPGGGWLVEEWENGPDVHFCPRHADPERRSRLAEGFMLVCARCGRTSKDDSALDPWWGGRGEGDERIIVCDDCHDSDRDTRPL